MHYNWRGGSLWGEENKSVREESEEPEGEEK